MNMRRIPQVCAARFLALLLGLVLLTGCGSTASAGGTSSTTQDASATATACAQLTRPATSARAAVGTLKSINGATLQLTNQRGSDVTVTYSSATRFTQEVTVPATSLQEGTVVRVLVSSSAGSYTATSIVVTGRNAVGVPGFPRGGTPGAGRGNAACFTRARGNGTPGANANAFRGLVGTVSHLSGSVLTVTDSAGTDFTVTITAQTQIVETKSATAAALKVGQALTVTGRAGSQGRIQASLVAILLALPTRQGPTTTTP